MGAYSSGKDEMKDLICRARWLRRLKGMFVQSGTPMLLLGVVDTGTLEKRIMKLMEEKLPVSRWWRVVSAVGCVVVMALACVGAMMFGVRHLLAQAAKAYTFDVVSVRLDKGGTQRPQRGPMPDGYLATNMQPINSITVAYVPSHGASMFNAKTVVGVPDWMLNERYDIDAKVAESDLADWQKPTLQPAMLRSMLEAMFAERFKLAVHREDREEPVYDLVVAKNGPKLKEAETVDAAELKQKHPGSGQPLPGGGVAAPSSDRGQITLYGVSMATLGFVLYGTAGRPIHDKTGLTGRYDISLQLDAGGEGGASATPQDMEAQIFTALQEQLGLKLEPAKGPVETLVIDHVERPSEN